ncbi:hypothetical protein BZG36_04146 [Bifiguratus adelaidae]|uniref:RAD51 interacting motif domain-containing protein n=1 Tax=Bifiguratus adelaidae TaxID=1938954 RepID=A0A261XZH1_9FUNG|nr:hypothetical protein BZG36_04146 [Bifiguratus adelaidae]
MVGGDRPKRSRKAVRYDEVSVMRLSDDDTFLPPTKRRKADDLAAAGDDFGSDDFVEMVNPPRTTTKKKQLSLSKDSDRSKTGRTTALERKEERDVKLALERSVMETNAHDSGLSTDTSTILPSLGESEKFTSPLRQKMSTQRTDATDLSDPPISDLGLSGDMLHSQAIDDTSFLVSDEVFSRRSSDLHLDRIVQEKEKRFIVQLPTQQTMLLTPPAITSIPDSTSPSESLANFTRQHIDDEVMTETCIQVSIVASNPSMPEGDPDKENITTKPVKSKTAQTTLSPQRTFAARKTPKKSPFALAKSPLEKITSTPSTPFSCEKSPVTPSPKEKLEDHPLSEHDLKEVGDGYNSKANHQYSNIQYQSAHVNHTNSDTTSSTPSSTYIPFRVGLSRRQRFKPLHPYLGKK